MVEEATDPPFLRLVPASPAVACIISHLTKCDKQQLSLSCKHAHVLLLAAVPKLNLGYKWCSACSSSRRSSSYSSSSGGGSSYSTSGATSCNGSKGRTTFPHCTCVAVRPRTVDELSKLTSELLLHQVKYLPALSEVRLELQGVYDKHYDLSLIVKSIPLHAAQLTSLYVQQSAMLCTKAVAAMAELPLLCSLTLKNAHGFEAGALSKLASVTGLTSLHLEITASSNGSSPTSPASQSSCSSTSAVTPSELARLLASDEVGLAKCTKLVSLAAISLTKPGAFRPVEALLQALAGSLKPRLSSLVLGSMPELPASVLDAVAGIPSLSRVSLAGCDVAGNTDMCKLSALTALTELDLAPQQPPAAALAAITKGCKRLGHVSVGAVQISPGAATMATISHLRLRAAPPVWGSSSGGLGSSSCIAASFREGVSLRVRPPVQITGLGRVWPGLRGLEISGWAVDAAGVAAIRQLEGLSSLKLVGGSEAGTALHAKLLLPLLELPELQQLVLLELADLTDEWVADAVRGIAATAGSAGAGSFAAVRELHLGAAAAFSAPAGTGNAAAAGTGTTAGSACSASTGAGSAAAAAASIGNGSQLFTDRGLVRLFACPRLHKLVLVQLPGITLAGIKALVRGSSLLAAIELVKCPAISAATPDVIARAALAAPDRTVDLWVAE